MMFGRFSIAVILATVVWSSQAGAVCQPSPKTTAKTAARHKCVDLGVIPQIANQIVADEKLPVPVKAPPSDAAAPANGPTIGLNNMVRRAPEVGYRWSIQ